MQMMKYKTFTVIIKLIHVLKNLTLQDFNAKINTDNFVYLFIGVYFGNY